MIFRVEACRRHTEDTRGENLCVTVTQATQVISRTLESDLFQNSGFILLREGGMVPVQYIT